CEDLAAGPTGGVAFLNSFFGANLKDKAYRSFSTNAKQTVELFPVSSSAFNNAGAPGLKGYRIGVSDGCGLENDVLDVYTPVTSAATQNFYENVGVGFPYGHSIYAPPITGTRSWTTYLDGSRIQRLGTYDPINPVLPMRTAGFQVYMWKALTIATAGLSCGPQNTPVGVGDNPGSGGGKAFVNFLNLKSSNPMRSGEARIAFGLAKTDKVEVRVYDVTGRLVKMVANRTFAGGQEHMVTWDGTDEMGNKVRSGVYFYQLKTHSWVSQKKLAVLSN